MNYKGHLAVATGSYLTIANATPSIIENTLLLVVGLFAALFGSLLPDIDHPNSLVGRRVRYLSVPISSIFGHRGITHSFIAIVLMCYGGYHIYATLQGTEWLILSLIIGYVSHVAIDSLSPAGIQLLYPLKRRFRPFILYRSDNSQIPVYLTILALGVWCFFVS